MWLRFRPIFPIYIVLEKTSKATTLGTHAARTQRSADDLPSAEELRQLLQLQRELNQSSTTTRWTKELQRGNEGLPIQATCQYQCDL